MYVRTYVCMYVCVYAYMYVSFVDFAHGFGQFR